MRDSPRTVKTSSSSQWFWKGCKCLTSVSRVEWMSKDVFSRSWKSWIWISRHWRNLWLFAVNQMKQPLIRFIQLVAILSSLILQWQHPEFSSCRSQFAYAFKREITGSILVPLVDHVKKGLAKMIDSLQKIMTELEEVKQIVIKNKEEIRGHVNDLVQAVTAFKTSALYQEQRKTFLPRITSDGAHPCRFKVSDVLMESTEKSTSPKKPIK